MAVFGPKLASADESSCEGIWSEKPPFEITSVSAGKKDTFCRPLANGGIENFSLNRKAQSNNDCYALGGASLVGEPFEILGEGSGERRLIRGSIVRRVSPIERKGEKIKVRVLSPQMVPNDYVFNGLREQEASPRAEQIGWIDEKALTSPDENTVFMITDSRVPTPIDPSDNSDPAQWLRLKTKKNDDDRGLAYCRNSSDQDAEPVYEKWNQASQCFKGDCTLGGPSNPCRNLLSSESSNLRNLATFTDQIRKKYADSEYSPTRRGLAFGTSLHGMVPLPMVPLDAEEIRAKWSQKLPPGVTPEGIKGLFRVSPSGAYVYHAYPLGEREPDAPYTDLFLQPKVACSFDAFAVKWQKKFPDFQLQVKDCAYQTPGMSTATHDATGHAGHRTGKCIDIRLLAKGGLFRAPTTSGTDNFDREMNQKLVSEMLETQEIDTVFYAPGRKAETLAYTHAAKENQKKYAPMDGHDNHIHFCFDPAKITEAPCGKFEDPAIVGLDERNPAQQTPKKTVPPSGAPSSAPAATKRTASKPASRTAPKPVSKPKRK